MSLLLAKRTTEHSSARPPTTHSFTAGGDALAEDGALDGINFLPSLLGAEHAQVRSEIVFTLPRSGTSWHLGQEATREAAVLRYGPYKLIITSVFDFQ